MYALIVLTSKVILITIVKVYTLLQTLLLTAIMIVIITIVVMFVKILLQRTNRLWGLDLLTRCQLQSSFLVVMCHRDAAQHVLRFITTEISTCVLDNTILTSRQATVKMIRLSYIRKIIKCMLQSHAPTSQPIKIITIVILLSKNKIIIIIKFSKNKVNKTTRMSLLILMDADVSVLTYRWTMDNMDFHRLRCD